MPLNKKVYEMTPEDIDVLVRSASDPNLFFRHFFKKPDMDRAFQLDYRQDIPWQEDFCLMSQKMAVIIAGVSTGKSVATILSACFFSAHLRGFKFYNIAQEQKQANLMYHILLDFSEDTLFEKLIVASATRPYPYFEIAFRMNGSIWRSKFEMLTLGDHKDAKHINGIRGDWINIEEAGLVEYLHNTVNDMRGRLTGSTSYGRPFLGRLSLISNPIDNPELWTYFEMAQANPDWLAMNIDTNNNKNNSQEQIDLILETIPLDEQEQYLTGQRPSNTGGYFSTASIEAGKSEMLSLMLNNPEYKKDPWFVYQSTPVLGAYLYKFPRQDMRTYYILGDPGIGAAPFRNAPVLMCFDTTDAPRHVPLVALWWGNGGGSIQPFVNNLISWIDYYKPIWAGVDNTATQKNMAELMNIAYVEGKGKSITSISGLDFSGGRKPAFLNALKLRLEANMFSWPSVARGIGIQLGKYDPAKDNGTTSNLAQDLVAVYSMAAFAVSSSYSFMDGNDSQDENQDSAHEGIRRSSRDPRSEEDRAHRVSGSR